MTGQEEQYMLLEMLDSIGYTFNPNLELANILFQHFQNVVKK